MISTIITIVIGCALCVMLYRVGLACWRIEDECCAGSLPDVQLSAEDAADFYARRLKKQTETVIKYIYRIIARHPESGVVYPYIYGRSSAIPDLGNETVRKLVIDYFRKQGYEVEEHNHHSCGTHGTGLQHYLSVSWKHVADAGGEYDLSDVSKCVCPSTKKSFIVET